MRPLMPIVSRAGICVLVLALSFGCELAAGEQVAVVSVKSSVTTLTKDQVADIFLGKASRFPDDSPAVPIDQLEGSAARDEFYFKFAGKSPAQVKAHWSKIIFTGRGQPPREVSNGIEARKRVAENPNAIGYIDSGMVDGSVRMLPAN